MITLKYVIVKLLLMFNKWIALKNKSNGIYIPTPYKKEPLEENPNDTIQYTRFVSFEH